VPFCTSCGHEAKVADRFCRKCGAPQPDQPRPAAGGLRDSLTPRSVSVLCYVPWLGWLASVYVLASGKLAREAQARFHAYQGLFLFVAWLVVHWVFGLWTAIFLDDHIPLVQLLELGVLVVWIFMLVKTSRGEDYELPIVGELARKSM